MSNYKKRAKKALNENFLYEDSITERIHPILEDNLREGKHSLAECGIFPEGDVITYEMKLIRERFKEVVHRCREAFNVDEIDNKQIMLEQMPLLRQVMKLEGPHKTELAELAVKMVMEEFDIPEGAINVQAELKPKINFTPSNEGPQLVDEEFNDHDEIVSANNEVKKRRVLNAMTQGASKKVNHMFHMVNDELSNMNPRLPGLYKKVMSAADYMYFVVPDMEKGVVGGAVDCDFSQGAPSINARAMTFPVLIHELCKGVMEVLASHGLPVQENIAKYVVEKADFTQAEPWDMRLGPAIWGRFCEAMPDDSFHLKHHVFTELASLEPNEFNVTMKEIIAKTKRGKEIISELTDEIKRELQEDEFNEREGQNYFDINDLI